MSELLAMTPPVLFNVPVVVIDALPVLPVWMSWAACVFSPVPVPVTKAVLFKLPACTVKLAA